MSPRVVKAWEVAELKEAVVECSCGLYMRGDTALHFGAVHAQDFPAHSVKATVRAVMLYRPVEHARGTSAQLEREAKKAARRPRR